MPPDVEAHSSVTSEPATPDEDQPNQTVVEPAPQDFAILPGASQESPLQSANGHRETHEDTEPENSTRPSATDESAMPQEPHAASSRLASGRRRYRRSYQLQLNLAQRPLFCCCCIGLGVEDARRLRRVLALTRAVVRQWR